MYTGFSLHHNLMPLCIAFQLIKKKKKPSANISCMYCSRKDCLTRADKPQKKKRLGSGSVSQSQNYFSFKKQKRKEKEKKIYTLERVCIQRNCSYYQQSTCSGPMTPLQGECPFQRNRSVAIVS